MAICVTVKVTLAIYTTCGCVAAIKQMLLTSCLEECLPSEIFSLFSPTTLLVVIYNTEDMFRRTACTFGITVHTGYLKALQGILFSTTII